MEHTHTHTVASGHPERVLERTLHLVKLDLEAQYTTWGWANVQRSSDVETSYIDHLRDQRLVYLHACRYCSSLCQAYTNYLGGFHTQLELFTVCADRRRLIGLVFSLD